MLRSVSASSASSVKIAPPSPKQPSGFAGKEAGRGRKAEGAEPAALVAGAKALRGVIEHEQAFGLGDGARSRHGRRSGRTGRPG